MVSENGYWTALENLGNTIESAKGIIVDTRDFCFNILKPEKFTNENWVLHLIEQQPELYLFTDDEVLKLLSDFKEYTGGNIEWRQIVLKNLPKYCISILKWYKEMLFQRDDKTGKWFCYTCYNKTNAVLISRKYLTTDNIEIL